MYSNPLVSVIIPAFNSGEFIRDTLSSVINQTYRNIEVIIVDDSSTDNTFKIVSGLAKTDDRIKVFSIPHSGRPSVPRNFGIHKSSGGLIAFIDSDDKWTPEKLKQQVAHFQKAPQPGFVYSMSVTFGNVNFFSPYYEVLPLFFRAARNRQDLLTIGNTIPLSSVIVQAKLLNEAGGFDESPELKAVEDYDLWLRLSEKASFLFIPRIYVYYRIHRAQFSGGWEIRNKRLQYLASKRGIIIPKYYSIREKNSFILFIRNVIHFKVFLFIKILGFIDRLK